MSEVAVGRRETYMGWRQGLGGGQLAEGGGQYCRLARGSDTLGQGRVPLLEERMMDRRDWVPGIPGG